MVDKNYVNILRFSKMVHVILYNLYDYIVVFCIVTQRSLTVWLVTPTNLNLFMKLGMNVMSLETIPQLYFFSSYNE
jgi:hypothetical protein